MSDLIPISIVVPIFASVVALVAGVARSETGWPIAVAGVVGHLAVVGVLAQQVLATGRIQYVVGGFQVPYGIELVVDVLTVTMLLLIAVTSLGVLAFARTAGPRSNPFYAAYLLLVAGLTGMTITADLFNMYVFLEITGLAAYTLVASGEGGRSAVAALRYLLIGTVGASLFLLGAGYAYIGTGTLNMGDLAVELAKVGHTSTLVQTAFAFIVVGLFIKVAIFPLHTWQPEAYAGSPDSVSALISALVSTISAYALIRVVFTVFTADFLAANPLARDFIAAAAAVSIVAGSLLAVAQTEVKRMLAYSSVAQFGLIVGAAATLHETALLGAVVHLVGHAIMKGGLFLAAGLIAAETGARTVDDYVGLGTKLPVGAGAFGLLAIGMVGVPPTIGFVGKWYIAVGAVESGSWALAAVIVASTLLTLAYFIRLVERMFFREARAAVRKVATDGGADADDVETADADESAAEADVDAADEADADPVNEAGGATLGMYVVVIAAAVLGVGLGLAVFEYAQLLEPTVETLLS